MPRGKKSSRGRKSQSNKGARPTVDLSGMLNRMGLPVPRLPFLIGNNTNLKPGLSVYPRMVKLDFPLIPQFAPIATGQLALSIAVSINLINQVGGLQALFAEYAIVGVVFELRCNAATTPQGIYLAYVDEKSGTTPTAALALDSPHIEGLVSNTESPSSHKIMWKAADYLDMDWTTLASSTDIPIWLKLFCSTSATGTSASTAGQIIVTGSLALCLRGYVGQN